MTNHNGNFVNLYTSRAHVFQINPETKTSWLAKGDQAIPISFVASIMSDDPEHETCKRELKIIGVADNGNRVLDATILPKTTFTKRSQKFGQWIDHTGTVYGLGFNSDAELTEFVETFQQLQRDILSTQPSQPHHSMNSSSNSQSLINLQGDRSMLSQQQVNNNVSENTNGRFQSQNKNGSVQAQQHQQYSNTLAHPGHQQQQAKRQQQQQQLAQINNGDVGLNNSDAGGVGNTSSNSMSQSYTRSQSMFGLQNKTNNINNTAGRATPVPEGENSASGYTAEWQMRDQLKYENERLKQALEESSKNAGMWHNELLNLRTNNVKLTQALQESKAHVEEWERELLSLRDENKELKLRVMALESADDPERGNEYHKDLQKYKSYVDEVQSELRKKESEIEKLQMSMEELELKAKGSSQNGQADDSAQFKSSQKQKLTVINAKLEAKLSELGGVQREFSQLLDALHNS